MGEKNKLRAAVSRIIEQTQTRELVWKVDTNANDLTIPSDSRVNGVYAAQVGDRILRLVPYRYRSSPDGESYCWEDDIVLELSDDTKRSWWPFPKSPLLWDLLEAVQFKSVGVEEFLDDLLEKAESAKAPVTR